MVWPMRRVLIAVSLALPLVSASSALAKEGAMFQPAVTALTPGSPTSVHLWVLAVVDNNGREVVPAPRAGSVPVIMFRSQQTGEVVRFTGTRLSQGEGFHPATAVITVPLRRTAQTWQVSVRAGGHTYPDVGQPTLPVLASSLPEVPPPTHHASPPAWPFALAGLVVALLGGGWIVRRHRGSAHDRDLASTPPGG
jgi:hypothetical protein